MKCWCASCDLARRDIRMLLGKAESAHSRGDSSKASDISGKIVVLKMKIAEHETAGVS